MKYYKENDYFVGVCRNGKKFKFSEQDYEEISKHSWTISKNYVETRFKSRKGTSLTKFIVKDNEYNHRIKFINKDCTDCRRENLFYNNPYFEENGYLVGKTLVGETYKIDKEDYDFLKQYVWHVDSNGYLLTKIDGKSVKMHRLLLGLKNGENVEVDHINRDRLDNRRCNLRLSDRFQNNRNKDFAKNNKSGAVGVYKSKSSKKWMVQIQVNGKKQYLGSYSSFEEAKKKRLESEIELNY